MTPTPMPLVPNTHTRSPESQYRVVRKRNRVPLSCAPCRSRKLKCTRVVPCENCVKRGDASSCSYAQPAARRRSQMIRNQPTPPDGMQNRIDRLENLVLSLMTNGSQSTAPSSSSRDEEILLNSAGHPSREDSLDHREDESDTEQVTKSFGIMKVDHQDQHSYYISEAHWTSILNDISEVKSFWLTHKKQIEEQQEKARAAHGDQELPSSALIFGALTPPNRTEIMASFPSKYIADTLIARYFASFDPSIHLIHAPTFYREYSNHWMDPSQTSIVWIGMLFAMMRLAMLSYHQHQDEPLEFRGKSLDIAKSYRYSMAQSLVLADYTKPHRYALETLILHLQGEYSHSTDAQIPLWVLAGVIVRLAMRMGYHRDSKMFPNVSAFQGEMRRRVWGFIRCVDLLLSFQVGLPSMVRSGDCDTDIPRSLYDDDFDGDSPELPPGRSLNEPTPVSYLVAKTRLASVFGRVLEHSQRVKGSTYEEVLELDKALRQARELVPERLNVRPIYECDADPAHLIMSRFGVMSVYHKAQCVLHRPFLRRARENRRYTYSHSTCIDSSMELLRYQAMLHDAVGPHGKVLNRAWYSNSSSYHDFLMAGTIIALDLYHDHRSRSSEAFQSDPFNWDVQRQQEMFAALQRSRRIWNELKDKSIDAWKAALIMGLLLERLAENPQSPEMLSLKQVLAAQDEKQSAAMTLGLLSSGMDPSDMTTPPWGLEGMVKSDPGLQQPEYSKFEPVDPSFPAAPYGIFGQMPDMQLFDLDWGAWDTYIQSASLDPRGTEWTGLEAQQILNEQDTMIPRGDPVNFGMFDRSGTDSQGNGTFRANNGASKR